MRLQIALYFTYFCLKKRANPWLFFQIHSKYFDKENGIFSKYNIEQQIPKKWRLKSIRLLSKYTKKDILQELDFPIFWKPEWWQNAHWISYINSKKTLEEFLVKSRNSDISYLVQQGSSYKNEYEICFYKNFQGDGDIIINSFSQSHNMGNIMVSSIHNETRYEELLHELTIKQIEKLSHYISQMWDFYVGRVWLKGDSIKDIVNGKFDVFEINIFLPMPLKLLAYNVDKSQKAVFLCKWAETLAYLTKHQPKKPYTEVFLRKIYLHYKIKILHSGMYLHFKKILSYFM